jgi:thiamine pyrophosphokinase
MPAKGKSRLREPPLIPREAVFNYMQRTETIPNRRAVIVANGMMSANTDLESLLRAGDLLIAADGGGRYCLQAGCMPHILIGDFDSLSVANVDQLEASSTEVFRHPTHKDETDLELALDLAINRNIHEILILAALGGRWDHTMANLLLLGLPRFSTARIHLLDGNQEITMLRPRAVHVILGRPGDTVSLIPVSGDAHGVTTSGLEYSLQKSVLPFGATLGVSNTLTAAEATISLQSGLLICIVIHNPRRRST